MNRRKIVLLVNSLIFLFSVLFLNLKRDTVTPNNILNIKQSEIAATPEVLSQDSDAVNYARVIKVIDGDTIKLENGEKVRYIGIDSPERLSGGECYYRQALEKNSELVLGKTVRLVKDVSERDKYQRLLRYVYIDPPLSDTSSRQSVFVNKLLVREGYAAAATYPPDVKFKDIFLEAQRLAREEGKGLWSECERVE
jgi:micrococcal nuclease